MEVSAGGSAKRGHDGTAAELVADVRAECTDVGAFGAVDAEGGVGKIDREELKGEDGITTFVVHPAEMSDKDLEEYEALFEERREQFVDYSEMLNIPAIKRNRGSDLVEYMKATAKHYAGKII